MLVVSSVGLLAAQLVDLSVDHLAVRWVGQSVFELAGQLADRSETRWAAQWAVKLATSSAASSDAC
jgi:hypothetical protein